MLRWVNGPKGSAVSDGRSGQKVVFVQVEPTTRCNFTCGFCSGRQMDQSDLSLENFERLLDSFPDIEHIELQGEGEPLLHKGFFEMARRARARGIRLSMITNGSLLSAERVAALLDVGVEAVNVSIESPDPKQFQRIRGGRFDKVKEGIARLLAARRARGLDRPKVGLAITVLKNTMGSLPKIAELYHELGMDGGATIQPLNRMDDYAEVYDSETAAQLLTPEEVARVWALVQKNPALRAMSRAARESRHFYPSLSQRFGAPHGCPWVKGGLYVDRHGGITTCCMVKDSSAYGIGKLGITPIEVVLAQRRAIDRALHVGHPPRQCEGCGYYLTPKQRLRARQRAVERRRRLAAAAAVKPG